MNKKQLGGHSGFTLIEMIVVAVIIAILAAVAVPAYIMYIGSSRTKAAANAAGAVASFCSSCLNAEGTMEDGNGNSIGDGTTITGADDGSTSLKCSVDESANGGGTGTPIQSSIRIPKRIKLTFKNPGTAGAASVTGQYVAPNNAGDPTTVGF